MPSRPRPRATAPEETTMTSTSRARRSAISCPRDARRAPFGRPSSISRAEPTLRTRRREAARAEVAEVAEEDTARPCGAGCAATSVLEVLALQVLERIAAGWIAAFVAAPQPGHPVGGRAVG